MASCGFFSYYIVMSTHKEVVAAERRSWEALLESVGEYAAMAESRDPRAESAAESLLAAIVEFRRMHQARVAVSIGKRKKDES